MRPIAFRIRDFKSIDDSDVCYLSGESITVLAGQNEAGKTAVLTALRDFDLEEESPPKTQDYQPEGRLDATPLVSVQFGDLHMGRILTDLESANLTLPSEVLKFLKFGNSSLWITRELQTGKFLLDESLTSR